MKKSAVNDFFFAGQQNKTDLFDFFHNNVAEFINTSNFPQPFFSIVALFAEDSKYNIAVLHSQYGILFIKSGYEAENEATFNELMLKHKNGDLIVARVQFIHQRKGNMTRLFEILKKIKNEYGLNRIIIESARTEAMQCWCNKNGLKPVFRRSLNYEYS